MNEGVVKWFNPKKGYGYIIDIDIHKDIFIHKNDINEDLQDKIILRKGQKVEFEIIQSKKGLQAKNLITVMPYERYKIRSKFNEVIENLFKADSCFSKGNIEKYINLLNSASHTIGTTLEWALKRYFILKKNTLELKWTKKGKKCSSFVHLSSLSGLLKSFAKECNPPLDSNMEDHLHELRNDVRNKAVHGAKTRPIKPLARSILKARDFLINYFNFSEDDLLDCSQLLEDDAIIQWPVNYEEKIYINEKPIDQWRDFEFPCFFRGFRHKYDSKSTKRFYEVDFTGIETSSLPKKNSYSGNTIFVPSEKVQKEWDNLLSQFDCVLLDGPPASSKSTFSIYKAISRRKNGWTVHFCEIVDGEDGNLVGSEAMYEASCPKNSMLYVFQKLNEILKAPPHITEKDVKFFLIIEDIHLNPIKRIKLLWHIVNTLKELKTTRKCSDFQVLLTSRVDKITLLRLCQNLDINRINLIKHFAGIKILLDNGKEDLEIFEKDGRNYYIENKLINRLKISLISKYFEAEVSSSTNGDPRKNIIMEKYSTNFILLGFACFTASNQPEKETLSYLDIYSNLFNKFLKHILTDFSRYKKEERIQEESYLQIDDYIILMIIICTCSIFETDITDKTLIEILNLIKKLSSDTHSIETEYFEILNWIPARLRGITHRFLEYLTNLGLVKLENNVSSLRGRLWHSKLAEYYLECFLNREEFDESAFLDKDIATKIRDITAWKILSLIPKDHQSRLFIEYEWFFNLIFKAPKWARTNLKTLSFGYSEKVGTGILQFYIKSLNPLPSDWPQLEILDLSSNKLTELPYKLKELRSLKKINLEKNKLTELPDFFNFCSNIEELEISNNSLQSLPSSFKNLNKLRVLDLRNNDLRELSDDIFKNLTNLEYIYLNNNKISDISPLVNCGNLKEVWVENNKISTLPKDIYKLNSLKILGMGGNSLKELPREIGNIKTLKALYLWGNQLKKIPTSIGALKNLSLLDLTGNYIDDLPPSLMKLSNLKYLYLTSNKLPAFSNGIIEWLNQLKEMKKVKILTMGGNISNIQGDCSSQEVICLGNKGISKIPIEIVNKSNKITELYLWENQIKVLNDSLGEFKNLRILDLRWNLLKTIPSSIGNLRLLEYLFLGGNQLVKLPISIGNLRALKELYLWNNQLDSMPNSITKLKNLEILRLGGNNLNQLPQNIDGLVNLKELLLWGNNLTMLPNQIGLLPNLEILGVVCNKLYELPDTIVYLKNLKFLYLWGNTLENITKRQKKWLTELEAKGCKVIHERKKRFNKQDRTYNQN